MIGAVVTGRVHGSGDPVGSWVNPTSLLTGALFVAVSAYLAAVYLTIDSERDGEPGMRSYFLRRALAAAVASGALAAVTLAVLHTTAYPVFAELLTGRALPLVVVSVLAGTAVLIMLARDIPKAVRPTAVIAVAAVIIGWAVAQYPYLLPPSLTIQKAAAPAGSEAAEACGGWPDRRPGCPLVRLAVPAGPARSPGRIRTNLGKPAASGVRTGSRWRLRIAAARRAVTVSWLNHGIAWVVELARRCGRSAR